MVVAAEAKTAVVLLITGKEPLLMQGRSALLIRVALAHPHGSDEGHGKHERRGSE